MSRSVQETRIQVRVTMDDTVFSMSAVVPKHLTTKAAKAAHVRDLADHIADCIELPRKVRKA